MASTPSPAAELPSTPPAPKFGGYYDTWEPYQPRKSARIASQSKSNHSRTPSPSTARTTKPSAAKVRSSTGRTPARASTDTMGSSDIKKASRDSKSAASSKPSDMLLTPTKTPRKPTTAKQVAEIDSVSRNIFHSNDPQLSNRVGRTPKKISGSTLESFVAEDLDQDFDIFSDSCNRIPQKDESNPFYNPRSSKQTKSQGKQKQVKIPGEGLQSIDKAARRDDGLLMNFRGKTVYRPLANPLNDDSSESGDVADGSTGRSFSSKVTPRLLWPKESKQESENADEEELTDVEDMNMAETDSAPPTPNTPPRSRKTPNAPKFPDSPPTTQRSTRSTDKLGPQPTPGAGTRHAQPMLNYRKWGSVAKSHKSSAASAKRPAEPLPEGEAKRSRT